MLFYWTPRALVLEYLQRDLIICFPHILEVPKAFVATVLLFYFITYLKKEKECYLILLASLCCDLHQLHCRLLGKVNLL
jgi:hypothetical protein